MRNLYHPVIAQSETDDLYNGTLIPRKYWPAAVSGSGIIPRGSPLTTDDGVTFTVSTENIMAILIFDIDTDETEEAQNACLGISGEFNKNKIEEALKKFYGTDTSLDDLEVVSAWKQSIYIEPDYKYPAVDMYPLG